MVGKIRSLFLLVVALVALAPVAANADCKSKGGCWMAQNLQARVEPETDCLHLSVTDDRCDCTAWVTIDNQCSAPLEARNFEFGLCRIGEEEPGTDCPEILPHDCWGNVFLPMRADAEKGHYEDDLWMSLGGDRLDVWVEYDVEKVTTGVGCASGGKRAGLFLWLALGMWFFRVRRISGRSS